ncbi:MAG: hypothetical protein WBK55_08365 [Alphaproteobacteria bacterium]
MSAMVHEAEAQVPGNVNSKVSAPVVTYNFGNRQLIPGRTQIEFNCGPENIVQWKMPDGRIALRPTARGMVLIDGQKKMFDSHPELYSLPPDPQGQNKVLSRVYLLATEHMARSHYDCIKDAGTLDYRAFKQNEIELTLQEKGFSREKISTVVASFMNFIMRDEINGNEFLSQNELTGIQQIAGEKVRKIYGPDWKQETHCHAINVFKACKSALGLDEKLSPGR